MSANLHGKAQPNVPDDSIFRNTFALTLCFELPVTINSVQNMRQKIKLSHAYPSCQPVNLLGTTNLKVMM